MKKIFALATFSFLITQTASAFTLRSADHIKSDLLKALIPSFEYVANDLPGASMTNTFARYKLADIRTTDTTESISARAIHRLFSNSLAIEPADAYILDKSNSNHISDAVDNMFLPDVSLPHEREDQAEFVKTLFGILSSDTSNHLQIIEVDISDDISIKAAAIVVIDTKTNEVLALAQGYGE